MLATVISLSGRIVLNTVIELGSMGAIKRLVKLGLGISIGAPWIAQEEREEGSRAGLPLGLRKLRRTWGIVHRQGRRLSLAEETVVNLCRKAAAKLNTVGPEQNRGGNALDILAERPQ